MEIIRHTKKCIKAHPDLPISPIRYTGFCFFCYSTLSGKSKEQQEKEIKAMLTGNPDSFVRWLIAQYKNGQIILYGHSVEEMYTALDEEYGLPWSYADWEKSCEANQWDLETSQQPREVWAYIKSDISYQAKLNVEIKLLEAAHQEKKMCDAVTKMIKSCINLGVVDFGGVTNSMDIRRSFESHYKVELKTETWKSAYRKNITKAK